MDNIAASVVKPTEVRIDRCGYVSQCKARGCSKRATLIAEVDTAGLLHSTDREMGREELAEIVI